MPLLAKTAFFVVLTLSIFSVFCCGALQLGTLVLFGLGFKHVVDFLLSGLACLNVTICHTFASLIFQFLAIVINVFTSHPLKLGALVTLGLILFLQPTMKVSDTLGITVAKLIALSAPVCSGALGFANGLACCMAVVKDCLIFLNLLHAHALLPLSSIATKLFASSNRFAPALLFILSESFMMITIDRRLELRFFFNMLKSRAFLH
mmetsp:Transcript_25250/g.69730  ORF Transcript_25250/g.69730 Transcript_25250/m.69730 type:complete len:206 (-) Transcript_25250:21-638(-)